MGTHSIPDKRSLSARTLPELLRSLPNSFNLIGVRMRVDARNKGWKSSASSQPVQSPCCRIAKTKNLEGME
ncbi:hypothetical protein MTR_3g455950 [Medicago truncatula]|uniref:Uncharacterized protein n=1 Tax=Medicago truncatula TaxID=3880 RepID=A0A072UY01_MEDTR|nr:hypothetical protein MTR_3g455950 [Medicago truncatula]